METFFRPLYVHMIFEKMVANRDNGALDDFLYNVTIGADCIEDAVGEDIGLITIDSFFIDTAHGASC